MKIIIVLLGFYIINEYIVDIDTQIKASVGKIWPKPKSERRFENKLMDPQDFLFTILGETCTILDEAIIRYTKIIKDSMNSQIIIHHEQLSITTFIKIININLTLPCEDYPYLEMDETYSIWGGDYIYSNSIWGILRGLETYSQSMVPITNGMLLVQHIKVSDTPRFQHRGLMLDTARHYININTIMTILDGMAYNKLNVFHWHIVDDESFPYQSVQYPELSEKGAYRPSLIYTHDDISKVIEYARMRGIRIVAEFDVPAHTRSWGNSHPGILTTCEWFLTGKLGPINPINDRAYELLNNLFSEVIKVFPDKFIHIGGNEVGYECWESNEIITNYITTNGISSEYLFKNFIKKISQALITKLVSPIVWQEAMWANNDIPNNTIVQIQLNNWQSNFNILTRFGHRVILSECWLLNKFSTNGISDWENDYNCDPHDFIGSSHQKKLVIGGEAIIWTHFIGNHNIIQSIFPRISAMAERLWSKRTIRNLTDAAQRLEEHTCRMILRGMPIESLYGSKICG